MIDVDMGLRGVAEREEENEKSVLDGTRKKIKDNHLK